ncbi:MAG: hypothetical protein KatS3mg104_2191 [Phycisphaerae bacterium]|jgi:hypothetical protein|nr:MAG: hypothetical protein KatS3mg104_2191 [Phycisphaerae bacterium]
MPLGLFHLFVILVWVLNGISQAQGDESGPVQAAWAAARSELNREISSATLKPGLTVAKLQEGLKGFSFADVVENAQQIGPPRWVDQNLVQVRLQVPAGQVLECITRLPDDQVRVYLSPSELARLKREWKTRTFQAIGQAIPASRLESLLTTIQTPDWREISPVLRVEAAQKARGWAVGKLVHLTEQIRIGPDQTIEQLLVPDGKDRLWTWAYTLPATSVQLKEDRQVEIGLYVDHEGLEQQVRQSVEQGALSTSESLSALSAGVRTIPTILTGRARVEMPVSRVSIPDWGAEIPLWVNDPIVAEGSSRLGESRLKTARQAERIARNRLRERIEQLEITPGQTLRQAVTSDPRVRQSIDRAVEQARVYQVDYAADGSVTVRVTLDPNELLDELSRSD